MDTLRRMAIFAAVVEKGSMKAAAQELGMTPSAVSQHINKLEERFDVLLLHRTTRKLSLTEAGVTFYQSCADMLAAAHLGEQRLLESRDEPMGELRISAPAPGVVSFLAEALTPLLIQYPKLSLRLFSHDRGVDVDLVGQRIDLAIRFGEQKDSSLIARHLADWELVVCAAPSYMQTHDQIVHPGQLNDHSWVLLDFIAGLDWFHLTNPEGKVYKPILAPRIVCNTIGATKSFVLAGMGLTFNLEKEVRQDLADGRLVEVLPDWKLPRVGVFAITARRDAQPAKVRYAIDALKQKAMEWC